MPADQNKFMPDRAEWYHSLERKRLHEIGKRMCIYTTYMYLFIRLTAIHQVATVINCG